MNFASVQSLRPSLLSAIAAAVIDMAEGKPKEEYRRAALEALLISAAEVQARIRGLGKESVPELMDVALRAMGEWPGTAESTGDLT